MSISVKIRRGQGPFWGTIKRAARAVLTAHVPVGPLTKPVFRLLYGLHVAAREGWIVSAKFLWYEPLFRSQCASVGSGFRMEQLPYLNGRGRIVVGDRVELSGKSTFTFGTRSEAEPALEIGDGTFIGHDCRFSVARSITVGKNCLLAGGVKVSDFDGHPVDAGRRRAHEPTPPEAIRPVAIGDDVWVGADAAILKGVTIGDRSIVGAGAVVTKSVPPDVVVAGNPARVVKTLDSRPAAVDA